MIKAKKKIARYLMTLIGVLGLCSTTLLLTDPPPSESDTTVESPSIFAMNTSMLTGQREVASVDESKAPHETLFELKCSDTDPKLETTNPRFRLKGETCVSSDVTSFKTQVQNLSNGYVATVFHRTANSFTTDYINLSEGQNRIDVRFETDKGMIERSITVVRAPGSVKKGS